MCQYVSVWKNVDQLLAAVLLCVNNVQCHRFYVVSFLTRAVLHVAKAVWVIVRRFDQALDVGVERFCVLSAHIRCVLCPLRY